jgi:hypothetical protein
MGEFKQDMMVSFSRVTEAIFPQKLAIAPEALILLALRSFLKNLQ